MEATIIAIENDADLQVAQNRLIELDEVNPAVAQAQVAVIERYEAQRPRTPRESLWQREDGRWEYCWVERYDRMPENAECAPRLIADNVWRVALGYCGHRPLSTDANYSKYHTDGHATQQEACDCFKQWCLDEGNYRVVYYENCNWDGDVEILRACASNGCTNITDSCARVYLGDCEAATFWLCDEHRNADALSNLIHVRPQRSGRQTSEPFTNVTDHELALQIQSRGAAT